LTSRHTHTQTA